MSGFSASWLGLREPLDHTSRDKSLTLAMAEHLARQEQARSVRAPLRVLDLGTGTGSNARYLFPFLGAWQLWTVVDADQALLSEWPARVAAWASRSGFGCVQKANEVVVRSDAVEATFRRHVADIAALPIEALSEGPSFVTASALLDLVSERWLAGLALACCTIGASVLFPLTYDGRVALAPKDQADDIVIRLVNRHQLTDKGFGVALGPSATAVAVAHFEAAGYDVRRARSDWHIGRDHTPLQAELLKGWVQAALEVDPAATPVVREWERARQRAREAGQLTITVGHEDIAAWIAPS